MDKYAIHPTKNPKKNYSIISQQYSWRPKLKNTNYGDALRQDQTELNSYKPVKFTRTKQSLISNK